LSYQYTNNASTTLSSGITAAATTATVSTGTGALFPILTSGNVFRATLVDAATQTLREIVQVTATAGDTFTIIRGQEGTTARAYNAGDILYLSITAGQASDYFSKLYDSFPNQPGRLINVQVISSTGTYTPTSGTNSIVFWLVGGGGGGGGASATSFSGNTQSVGSGGSGGAVVIHRATSGFSGQTVTIGAGGTRGAGANGGNGGNSTFLGCTATGGFGGVASAALNTYTAISPGVSVAASGGNILNLTSRSGQYGLLLSITSAVGGAGGGNYLAADTPAFVSPGGAGAGYNGYFPGGGGGGAVNPLPASGTNPAQSGGLGSSGVCVIYEYA